ncbi:MAG: aldehyde dehydrogenase [Acidimicrobiales bacterium]
MISRDCFFVGGGWVTPESSEMLDVISPTTELPVGRVAASTDADMDRAVAAARSAFEDGPWPHMSVKERGEFLLGISEQLKPRAEELARLQVDEMGSPYTFIRAVTDATLGDRIAHEVGSALDISQREIRDGVAGKVVVFRDPIGAVAGIIPWNAPLYLVFGKMLPALLTGCTIVIKPAPETPLSAYPVAEAAMEVGLPTGVLNIVPGGREVGEHLVCHPGVDRVAFTGSSAAGARIASLCGERLKSVSLELGGKSAAIVLDDADFDRDVPMLVGCSMPNTGQVCVATTRILVSRERSDELVDRLVSSVAGMKVGDPHEADTAFGPLVASRQRDRVENYITLGKEQGAKIVLGGGRPENMPSGWFVEPTIFTEVDNSMTIAREEIFGPVVCVIEYCDVNEAISIANDSEYGLGGAIFTSDPAKGLEVASQVVTGSLQVNNAPPAGGGGPFGGVKRSGIGKEFGPEGFDGYFNIKSVALPSEFVPS